MDFTFSDDQNSLREAAREAIARHKSEPVAGAVEHNVKLWQALAELGALGLPFAEAVGGMGAGPIEAMVVASELGRVGERTAYSEMLTAATLLGSDDLVAAAIEGTTLVVPALFEPGRAWSPTPHGVRATGDALTGCRMPRTPGPWSPRPSMVPRSGSSSSKTRVSRVRGWTWRASPLAVSSATQPRCSGR